MHQDKQFLFAMTSLTWAKMVDDAFAWPSFNNSPERRSSILNTGLLK